MPGLPSNSQADSDHYCSSFEAEYFTSTACHVLLFLAYLAISNVFVSSSADFFITASVGLGLSSGKNNDCDFSVYEFSKSMALHT